MSSGPVSPSIYNYSVLRATLTFDGTALGNVTKCTLTPDNTTLEHRSSMAGIGLVDRTVATGRKLSIALTGDEWSEFNMRLATMSPASGAMNIYTESEREGPLVVTGTNDIGQKFTWTLPSVSLLPSGSIDLIGEDDWSTYELEGTVNAVAGVFGTVARTGGEVEPA